MRMRRNQMQTVYLKRRHSGKDAEGTTIETWDDAIAIKAIVWKVELQATQVTAALYGETLPYIYNMQYQDDEEIGEMDGICVFVGPDQDPDFHVVSVNPTKPKQYELRKRIG